MKRKLVTSQQIKERLMENILSLIDKYSREKPSRGVMEERLEDIIDDFVSLCNAQQKNNKRR